MTVKELMAELENEFNGDEELAYYKYEDVDGKPMITSIEKCQ